MSVTDSLNIACFFKNIQALEMNHLAFSSTLLMRFIEDEVT